MAITIYEGTVEKFMVKRFDSDTMPEIIGFWASLVDTDTGLAKDGTHPFSSLYIASDEQNLVMPGARFYYMVHFHDADIDVSVTMIRPRP